MAHVVTEADGVVHVPTGDAPVRAVYAAAVYRVMTDPPSPLGAVQVAVIDVALPTVGAALTAVGAPGGCFAVGVVTFTRGLDAGLLPPAFFATTSTK